MSSSSPGLKHRSDRRRRSGRRSERRPPRRRTRHLGWPRSRQQVERARARPARRPRSRARRRTGGSARPSRAVSVDLPRPDCWNIAAAPWPVSALPLKVELEMSTVPRLSRRGRRRLRAVARRPCSRAGRGWRPARRGCRPLGVSRPGRCCPRSSSRDRSRRSSGFEPGFLTHDAPGRRRSRPSAGSRSSAELPTILRAILDRERRRLRRRCPPPWVWVSPAPRRRCRGRSSRARPRMPLGQDARRPGRCRQRRSARRCRERRRCRGMRTRRSGSRRRRSRLRPPIRPPVMVTPRAAGRARRSPRRARRVRSTPVSDRLLDHGLARARARRSRRPR